MQNIESTIVELGQIFTQLAHMVKEQDEAVQRLVYKVQRLLGSKFDVSVVTIILNTLVQTFKFYSVCEKNDKISRSLNA